MPAQTKNWAVTLLDTLSVAETQRTGPQVYADVGSALMYLARQDETRELYGIGYQIDLHTKEPVALWTRALADGEHTIATSAWEGASFLMQDLKLPKDKNPGLLRLYIFGNDSSVRGLMKAYKIIKVEGLDGVPNRAELDARVSGYLRHPTARRIVTSAEGAGTFVRLARSLVQG